MTDTIIRKIHFYHIVPKRRERIIDPRLICNGVNNLEFNENGRYLSFGEGHLLSIYFDSLTYPIKGKLGTIRKKGLPLIEQRGHTNPLTIPSDAGLFEPMHFVLFDNNVVGFEFNFYGPRPGSLKTYLENKAENQIDDVELFPLMRSDVQDLISRIGEVRVFRFKAHRDIKQYLRDLDDNLFDAFDAIQRMGDAQQIEVVLRPESHSRESINVNFLNRLYSWITRQETRALTETLKITAFDLVTCRNREFDLLQEYIRSSKQVIKQDDYHRSVNSNAMYDAIIQSYQEVRGEIDEIVNRR